MNSEKRKILFVLEHFPPYIGGVENLFRQLAKELVKQGVNVTVITTRHSRSLPRREIVDGIMVRRVNAFNRYLFTLFALPAVIRHALKADLIHTTTYNAALPAFLAGWLCRKRVIITIHEVWDNLWTTFPWINPVSGRLHRLYERAILRIPFHHYIAVSEFTHQTLVERGLPFDKIDMICNGIDYQYLSQFKEAGAIHSGKGCRFIYYGRLGHSKGLDLIVKAGEQFFKTHPDAVIELIVPRHPVGFRKKLEREIAARGNPQNFVITGSLPAAELFARLQTATGVLIPSCSEGFCFAAAECAALDIPVIHSNKGALAETTGGRVIVMEGFSAESLLIAMEKAAAGEWQMKPAKRFPLDQQVKEYLALYDRLLNAQASAG